MTLFTFLAAADDRIPLSVLVWAGQMVVFHSAGLVFEWCDRTGALRRFKVRRFERRRWSEFLPRVLLNQTFVLLPCMWLCEKAGLAFVGNSRIGAFYAVSVIVLMTIGHDVVQYATHRGLLHNPRFRRLDHNLHHSTAASCSITACYMSGPDFFLTIVCPYLIPLMAIGGGSRSIGFQLLLASMGALGGLYEHSGYDFAAGFFAAPLRWNALIRGIPSALVSTRAHGEHHRRWCVSFSDGFGSPGLCDRLFRTRWDQRQTPSHPSSNSRCNI